MSSAPDRTQRPNAPAETAALVAGMAHEINNPITYVLANLAELSHSCAALGDTLSGYRSALRRVARAEAEALISDIEAKLDDAGGVELAADLLTDATEGAQRIRDLVRDLLSLSRSAERPATRLAIADLLEQTLRLVSRSLSAHAELVRDFRATREIHGDRTRLGQVFLNLLQNASDACACASGGAHKIFVRTRDTATGVRIEIEDTGPGVPAELAPTIFAPFVTTKSETHGTGLGLYISRSIVAEHGGTLELVQAPGRGAMFRVELPGLV
jgi:signal transduction histidine kinase